MKNNIKSVREHQNMTQKECADTLGITLRAWQTYEQGVSEPKHEILCKIADMFDVTLDYLLGRPDAKPPVDPVEEFADRVQMQEQEQIILKKWLLLDEKQRRAVYDFMVDIVHEYESVQSNAQSQSEQIQRSGTYEFSEQAIARSSDSNYKPAPTEEQYNDFDDLPDDMLGE